MRFTAFSAVRTALDIFPVSYTHLDVYKRQPVGLLEIWGMQGRYLVPVFALLPFIGQNIFPLVRKDAVERSTYNILFIAMLFIVFVLLKTTAQYY